MGDLDPIFTPPTGGVTSDFFAKAEDFVIFLRLSRRRGEARVDRSWGQAAALPKRWAGRTMDWLRRVPAEDRVDQRAAVFLQLMLIAVLVNVLLAYLLNAIRASFDPAILAATGARYGLVALPTIAALWLARSGRVKRAGKVFIAAALAAVVLGYAETGIRALPVDLMPLLIMTFGAYLLGGRALWTIFGVITLAVVAAVIKDQFAPDADLGSLGTGAIYAGARILPVLSCALILEFTMVALRREMKASEQRESELAALSERLQEEVDLHIFAQRQLSAAQRAEAAGRISTGVAHDFGNLLNIISGYAEQRELLADQGTDALVDAMRGIELAAKRGQALNRRLLDFARQDPPLQERFELREAIDAAAPLIRQVLGREIEVVMDVPESGLPIRFDRAEFDLISINLASNARDAMAGTGTFTISAARDGAFARITYADTGIGADATELSKLFEPFYSGKPRGAGTGLGLSVIMSLMQRAGGSIQASSHVGQGLSMTLRFPLAQPAPVAVAPDQEA